MKREELIQKTIETFCDINEVSQDTLSMKVRNRSVVDCRRMIWAYLRENTSMTLLELAHIIDFENHATILYHCKQHQELITKTERGKWMYPSYGPYYEQGATQLNAMVRVFKMNQKFQNYALEYRRTEDGHEAKYVVNSLSLLDAVYQHETMTSMAGYELISVKLKES